MARLSYVHPPLPKEVDDKLAHLLCAAPVSPADKCVGDMLTAQSGLRAPARERRALRHEAALGLREELLAGNGRDTIGSVDLGHIDPSYASKREPVNVGRAEARGAHS